MTHHFPLSAVNHRDGATLDGLMALAMFLIPALALVAPTGYSWGAALLLITSITVFVKRASLVRAWQSLPFGVKAIVFFMLAYAAVWIVDAAMRGEGVREFDRPSRFLFAAVSLIALTQCRIKTAWLWAGVATGGALSGGTAIWEKIIEGSTRASGTAQTILFGNISMLLALMCIAGFIWAWAQPRRWFWFTLLSIGAVGGLSASFLSGTRGAWLVPMTMLLAGLALAFATRRARLYVSVVPLVFALIYGGVYMLPATGVKDRVDRATAELTQYLTGESERTSVGYRLEMWRGGWILFSRSPWVGWGENAFIEEFTQLAEEGVITGGAARFTHSHNEWVNVAAKRGLVGMTVLGGLYLTPFLWFWQLAKSASRLSANNRSKSRLPLTDQTQMALAVAGIAVVVTFFTSGQTQVNLNHNSGAMMYSFMLAIVAGLSVRNFKSK